MKDSEYLEMMEKEVRAIQTCYEPESLPPISCIFDNQFDFANHDESHLYNNPER